MDPFGVGGAADEVADFGPEAGGGGGRLLSVVVAARAEGQHALEGLLGPQEAALVDGQGTGVVQYDTSVLKPASKKHKKKTKKQQNENVLCTLYFPSFLCQNKSFSLVLPSRQVSTELQPCSENEGHF